MKEKKVKITIDTSEDTHDDVIDSTSAQDKAWKYLKGLCEDPSFQQKIRRIRKKYNLPSDGIQEVRQAKSKVTGQETIYLPEHLSGTDFQKEVDRFTKELGLSWSWSEVIQYYITYNQWFDFWSYGGLVQVDDLNEYINGPFRYEGDEEGYLEYVKMILEEHPIAITVSPYATLRDMLDFLKKTYKTHIEPLQNKYKNADIKLGKMRKRNTSVLERNQFIYKNKHIGSKKLMGLVSDKFGEVLDYTYIDKIISDEKKKRK
ncbi:MAG: hypothetical protein L6Q29_01325 [Candidatus Pacebacteria bacterium]|nr:hypothetical protein [Candidatus Paceibacterota bacterium]